MKKIYLLFLILVIISFILFYNSRYFIKLNGEKEITINLNEEYKELGATTLFNQKVRIEGIVDNSKIGIYEIKYYHGNSYKIRKVRVIDSEPPIITLNGDSEINVVLNGNYWEQGYKAVDNYDGDLTNKVVVKSNLDTSKEGTYEITYEVKDSSGNSKSITRKINVNTEGPMSLSIKDFTLDGYFTSTILKENNQDNNYLSDTIFYGDSITENLAYYQNISYNNIWAVSNLTPITAQSIEVMFYKYNEKINIIDGLKKYTPKRIIINLGTNSVAVMNLDYFIKQYENLIEKLKEASPNTEIIVESIFPVDDRWDLRVNTINNTKINNVNYLLAEMCERQNIYFLNTAEILKNENGTAIKGYLYESDGIHPLPIGNQKILEYVNNHQVPNE